MLAQSNVLGNSRRRCFSLGVITFDTAAFTTSQGALHAMFATESSQGHTRQPLCTHLANPESFPNEARLLAASVEAELFSWDPFDRTR
jgi:hypothetical protein